MGDSSNDWAYIDFMATVPGSEPSYDVREQLVRIDKMQVELQKLSAETLKVKQDTRYAPLTIMFTGLGAGAALIVAGAALAKLLIG